MYTSYKLLPYRSYTGFVKISTKQTKTFRSRISTLENKRACCGLIRLWPRIVFFSRRFCVFNSSTYTRPAHDRIIINRYNCSARVCNAPSSSSFARVFRTRYDTTTLQQYRRMSRNSARLLVKLAAVSDRTVFCRFSAIVHDARAGGYDNSRGSNAYALSVGFARFWSALRSAKNGGFFGLNPFDWKRVCSLLARNSEMGEDSGVRQINRTTLVVVHARTILLRIYTHKAHAWKHTVFYCCTGWSRCRLVSRAIESWRALKSNTYARTYGKRLKSRRERDAKYVIHVSFSDTEVHASRFSHRPKIK